MLTHEALTPEDVRILGLENDRIAGHTLKVMDLVPGERLTLDELREFVGARLGRIPRLRQRLGDGPSWVHDAGFDLDDHVRAGERDVARVMERRLDRDKPLWSIDLLDGRRLALKVHHAMADGTGVRRIAAALLWDDPEDVPVVAAATPHGHGSLARELAPKAAPSFLAHRVGPTRTVAFAEVPLARLEPLKHAFDTHVTVNDLVLAATAGGLRRWLRQRDAPLTAMRVKVPVSLHRPGDAIGNADSCFFAGLPVAEPDPRRRLLAIAHETAARKRAGDAQRLDALLHGRAGRPATRWAMSPRVFTLSVSNVPGPAHPVQACGRPLRAAYALAEVADGHALRVAVLSACGLLTFGLCADAARVDDLSTLARGIEQEIEALEQS